MLNSYIVIDCKRFPYEGTEGELRFIAFVLFRTEDGTITESKYQLYLPPRDKKRVKVTLKVQEGLNAFKILIVQSPDWEVDFKFLEYWEDAGQL
jgi:hypothetical protein